MATQESSPKNTRILVRRDGHEGELVFHSGSVLNVDSENTSKPSPIRMAITYSNYGGIDMYSDLLFATLKPWEKVIGVERQLSTSELAELNSPAYEFVSIDPRNVDELYFDKVADQSEL